MQYTFLHVHISQSKRDFQDDKTWPLSVTYGWFIRQVERSVQLKSSCNAWYLEPSPLSLVDIHQYHFTIKWYSMGKLTASRESGIFYW